MSQSSLMTFDPRKMLGMRVVGLGQVMQSDGSIVGIVTFDTGGNPLQMVVSIDDLSYLEVGEVVPWVLGPSVSDHEFEESDRRRGV